MRRRIVSPEVVIRRIRVEKNRFAVPFPKDAHSGVNRVEHLGDAFAAARELVRDLLRLRDIGDHFKPANLVPAVIGERVEFDRRNEGCAVRTGDRGLKLPAEIFAVCHITRELQILVPFVL